MRHRGGGGLYIKELVSGDRGRTRPSFAEVLGREALCIELDVCGWSTRPPARRAKAKLSRAEQNTGGSAGWSRRPEDIGTGLGSC